MASSKKLPNIILIIMDTAGAKRCSAYGYHRDTTPGLCRIAEEGVLYKYCFAPAPWTIPSHASLFSGLYPSWHGCDVYIKDLPETIHNLPDILQKMGYCTISISSNLLVSQEGFEHKYEMNKLFNSRKFKEAREAFDNFKKVAKSDLKRLIFLLDYCLKNKYFSFPILSLLDRIYRRYFGNIKQKSCYATERSFWLAKRLLTKNHNNRPLFLFINCVETHWRYYPPLSYIKIENLDKNYLKKALELDTLDMLLKEIPENILNTYISLYELELRYITDKVWDFYSFLKNKGLQDHTMFIVSSDHGESLGEHGFWGHNFGLYNEVIHIPLIIKYPKEFGLNGEEQQLCQLHDLFATILDVIQSPLPVPESSISILSKSRNYAISEFLNPLGLKGLLKRNPNYNFIDTMLPCRAIINHKLWKLIGWQDGRQELFNINADYNEADNLIENSMLFPLKNELFSELQRIIGPFPEVNYASEL